VKVNPSIPIKSLIAEIQSHHIYYVIQKNLEDKTKGLAMQFRDWKKSYKHLPKWLQALQETLMRTIVQYTGHPTVVESVEDHYTYILDRVFWAFKPCIDDFNYCKPIVQVDDTFLTGKYHDTLLNQLLKMETETYFYLHLLLLKGKQRKQ